MSRALALFRSFQEDLDAEALASLRGDVRAHLVALAKAQQKSELIALDLAEQLCTRLEALLDQAPSFDSPSRAMVVGAARYFVSDDDARPDAGSCTGLDDDVAVFNHVVSQLGRSDLLIAD